jgi:hypothetical protein
MALQNLMEFLGSYSVPSQIHTGRAGNLSHTRVGWDERIVTARFEG